MGGGGLLIPKSSEIITSTDHFAKFVNQFVRFFEEFEESQENESRPKKSKKKEKNKKIKKYKELLAKIEGGSTLNVEMDDLISFFSDDPSLEKIGAGGLLSTCLHNTKRAICILYEAASRMVPSSIDPLMAEAKVPVHLRCPYDIRIIPPSSTPCIPLRELRGFHMGGLVKVQAVVCRVTGSKPRMQLARYVCSDCGSVAFQPVEGREFLPQSICHSASCQRTARRGDLSLKICESKMTRHQEAQVQEPADQVPQGNVPRNLKIVLEGNLTRQLSPGSTVTLGGVLVPVARSGFAAMKKGLVTDTVFEVEWIQTHKKGYSAEIEGVGEEELKNRLASIDACPNPYELIAKSIAPSIHGHLDIKKALLLQMVSGVRETFSDGLNIRGDIHILLMGDPGVAKSQLLGQVCKIAPRAHYTAGKGASGVGLTASVTRDPISNEFVLEAGAIVLADNGICAIDEFDKMDETDRTSIHEVMEQQTISIAKAGLVTSLNARTAILAAANPAFGRYDPTKSPMANINLPAALLSRFDLQFLLLDTADRRKDFELAKHIIFVHSHRCPPVDLCNSNEIIDADLLRLFVARARLLCPKLPEALVDEVAENYVELRNRDRLELEKSVDPGGLHSYTSPRTLLAILRMSQALARIRRAEEVNRVDVEESMRLMVASKESIVFGNKDNNRGAERSRHQDFRSSIIKIVKDLDKKNARQVGWSGWIDVKDVVDAAEKLGHSNDEVTTTLKEYAELEVLVLKGKSKVGFAERVQ